ncbi:MAG: metal-dependent transcriptional regulator [Acidimicrobiia bacterium]|nr:metal-dependent transcriptional regulator [Acidimicrobiia bacterium]
MAETTYRATHREYVGAMWEMEAEGLDVRQARIADWLGVSRASVSEMMRKLADEGLVTLDPLGLTDDGRTLAEVTVRRHRLAERFLSEVLRLPWDKVHPEAEVWENVISDDVEAAMWAAMDDPKTCPHGNPIPGAGYTPPPMRAVADLEPGERHPLERISEELELDDEMMGYLDRSGLRPGALVEIADRGPSGTLTVRVADGASIGLSPFAAERLFVAVSPARAEVDG